MDRRNEDDHFRYIINNKNKSIAHYEIEMINIHLTVSYSEIVMTH